MNAKTAQLTKHRASIDHFPKHKSTGIHIDALKSIAIEAQGSIKQLWRHVTMSTHLHIPYKHCYQ